MLVRNGYFSLTRSVLSPRNKFFFFTLNLNYICETNLVKALLIFLKQNLRYTLYFSVINYFKKKLCRVAQEISYAELVDTIVIVIDTQCYSFNSFLIKTQNLRKIFRSSSS